MEKASSGKQSNSYFREYYLKNRGRIQKRNKESYRRWRSNPDTLVEHRKRSSEATKRWRSKHPEKVKKLRKNLYDKRKRKAMDMVGGSICVRCGCDIIVFLEFNHKNGGGCKEWRTNKSAMADRILKGERGFDDLEILCRLCNAHDYLERKYGSSAKRFKVIWN